MSRAFVAALGLVAGAAGCWDSSSDSDAQIAQLGPVSFEVPADWRRTDTSRPGSATAVWTPAANENKESVTVIRSARSKASAAASLATVEQQLVTAQRSLRGARISQVTPVTTEQGLHGARIEVRFKPGMMERTYRRIHVVLVEDDALIHVLYTSAAPDGELAALDLVLDTIREEGES